MIYSKGFKKTDLFTVDFTECKSQDLHFQLIILNLVAPKRHLPKISPSLSKAYNLSKQVHLLLY